MISLDKDIVEKISISLAEVEGKLAFLRGHPDENYKPVNNDFIHPTVIAKAVPLDSKDGKYYYLEQTRDALTTALQEGIIPPKYQDYVIRAPKKISGLLAPKIGEIKLLG